MILVAFRAYDFDDVPAVDRLYRRGKVYALQRTGGGESEHWSIYTPEDAQAWIDSLGPDDETLTVVG